MNLSFPPLELDSQIVDILRDGTFAGGDDISHIKGSSAKPGVEFQSRPTDLAKPDEEVVYLLVKLSGQPRL